MSFRNCCIGRPEPGRSTVLPSARVCDEAKREDGLQSVSINHMKEIAMAMHNYHATHKRFPPRAVFDKNGKPLLSWRELLPSLGEEKLFKQFHLDEPWDGPHNKKLIEKMPLSFRSPAGEAPPNTTTYLVPVGEATLFEGEKGISIRKITDGTSNTVLLVEANDAEAVPWTKPDEFKVDPNDPKKGLVGSWPDGFLLGLADGSTVFVPASVDPAVLEAVFSYGGGEQECQQDPPVVSGRCVKSRAPRVAPIARLLGPPAIRLQRSSDRFPGAAGNRPDIHVGVASGPKPHFVFHTRRPFMGVFRRKRQG